MAGIRDLAPIVLIFGIAGLILAFVSLIGAEVGDEIADQQGAANLSACTTVACNATSSLLDAFNDFAGWFSLLVLIVVAAIIISLLIRSFSGGGSIR